MADREHNQCLFSCNSGVSVRWEYNRLPHEQAEIVDSELHDYFNNQGLKLYCLFMDLYYLRRNISVILNTRIPVSVALYIDIAI